MVTTVLPLNVGTFFTPLESPTAIASAISKTSSISSRVKSSRSSIWLCCHTAVDGGGKVLGAVVPELDSIVLISYHLVRRKYDDLVFAVHFFDANLYFLIFRCGYILAYIVGT